MYNEDIRVKQVYEDFDFDHENQMVLKQRENQALQLIKEGKMPVEIIKGEISLLIRNSQGLLSVAEKPYLYVKLKRVSYENDGTRKKMPPLVKICSRFAAESGDIDQKIPIAQFNGLDKNRQADTLTLELYMKPDDQPSDAGATFIGECFVPFKKCFEQDNLNNWLDYQMFLSDETGKAS